MSTTTEIKRCRCGVPHDDHRPVDECAGDPHWPEMSPVEIRNRVSYADIREWEDKADELENLRAAAVLPNRDKLILEVFYQNEDDAFISAINGRVTTGDISRIEEQIYQDQEFQDGDGTYRFEVENDDWGGWSLKQVGFEPAPLPTVEEILRAELAEALREKDRLRSDLGEAERLAIALIETGDNLLKHAGIAPSDQWKQLAASFDLPF